MHSITDLFDDPDVDPKVTAGLRGAGLDFRSTLAVPMKRDDAVVGVLVIARGANRPIPPAPDRTRADLRRPGRHRDRERAAVRRGAGAHARPRGGAATADRDRRRAEGHQPLGVRSAGGVRHADRHPPSSFAARSAARSAFATATSSLSRQRRHRSQPRLGAVSGGASRDAGTRIDRRPRASVGQGRRHSRRTRGRGLRRAARRAWASYARPARRAAAARRTGSRARWC